MVEEETESLIKKCLENWSEISKEWPHPCVATLNNLLIFAKRKGMTERVDLSSGAIGRAITQLIKRGEIVIDGITRDNRLCLDLPK